MMRRRLLEIGIALPIVIAALLLLEWGAGFIEGDDPSEKAFLAEDPGPKEPGTFRIVAVGSSTVVGLPAPPLGFVAQLDFWLRRSGIPVEVVNLGVVGIPAAATLENARRATQLEPDLILVHAGFGPYFLENPPIRPGEVLRSKTRGSTLARMVTNRVAVIAKMRDKAAFPIFERGSPEFEERLAVWIENIEAIDSVLEKNGTPYILATSTGNLSDWAPFNRNVAEQLYEPGFTEVFDRIQMLLDEGRFADARSAADEGLVDEPDDALLLFLRAKAAEGEGRFEDARRDYRRARDLDPLAWRPFSEANDAVRRIAGESDAILVDFEAALAEAAPNGLVGFDLVFDNAHPTMLGGSILVGAILEAMAENEIAISKDSAYFSESDPVSVFRKTIREQTGGPQLEIYALVYTGNYLLIHPFYRNREARHFFEAAVETDAEDWRGWAGLAAVSLLDQEIDAGVEQLEKAVALRGSAKGIIRERLAPALGKALHLSKVELDPETGRITLP